MKLAVGIKENQDINGFVCYGINKDLSEIDDGECTEIRGVDILNYIHINNIEEYIGSLCKKLRTGGTIVIGGFNYKTLINSALTLHDVNIRLFGDGSHKVCGFYDIMSISKLLSDNNIEILTKDINIDSFYISGKMREKL
jgi:hypothetical protein